MGKIEKLNKYPVKSVVKTLNVLEHLGTSPSGTTLTEISTKLGIGKSTIHRLLATLRDHDFVWLDPMSSRYILGARILQLSEQLNHQSILIRYGEPILSRLAAETMREIYSRDKFPNVDGVVAVVHESGCGMPDGAGLTLLNQRLTNTLRHPNLGSAIYLDLGCGKTCVECSVPLFQAQLPTYNQRVVNMTVQQLGVSQKTIIKGLETVD